MDDRFMDDDDVRRAVGDVTPRGDRNIAQLIDDLTGQTKRLVRDELRLAMLELTDKGVRSVVGAGLFGVAGVLAVLGAAAMVAAAIVALAIAVPAWLSALIVGAALLVIAGLLALAGRGQLGRARPPMPAEAAEGLRRDLNAVREGASRA